MNIFKIKNFFIFSTNTVEEKSRYLERTRQKLQLAKSVHEKFEIKMHNESPRTLCLWRFYMITVF